MRMKRVIGAMGCISAAVTTAALAAPARIDVDASSPGHAVSPTLWGLFFEDINLSTDGGIYPEQVRNRSFEDSDRPEHWLPIGAAEIALDDSRPLSARNPHCLLLTTTAPDGGVVNGGYWGMALRANEPMVLTLWARGTGTLSARLQNYDGSTEYARGAIGALDNDWRQFRLSLIPTGTDPKARLEIRMDQAGTCWLDMVSLMPANTWKGHGLRPDLCEMLAGLKPAFFRFPGGCWVEGDTMDKAYRWKKTIGDVSEREPLWNIWGYWATHGLGYHEYLQLAEDLGAEPMFCVNAGMSHKEVVPMDKMAEFVQDALDAIEYANGPVDSTWGALRAAAGHPAPFNMKYLQIGNENGGPAYRERWALFHRAIKAKYPEIQLVACVWGGYPKDPMPDIIDEHYYNDPEFFIGQTNKYDDYDRNGPKVFVGEYAVTRGCGQGNLRGAIGEAAFMTGLERNSDMVTMAAYAPLLVNVNHRRWNPDLINFDSSRVYGLPSYYVQQMFAENPGDVVLPVTVSAEPVMPAVKGGAIGVGTWLTQAEFKDLRVTRGDEVLFESDFSKGTEGWRLHGGRWETKDGVLRQTTEDENVRAFIGDHNWSSYTLRLKARKLGGNEGFLVSFRVQDEGAKAWWNIGGWGNKRHSVEMAGVSTTPVNGSIETGRWYDIRIELQGAGIRCYLDDKLVHDVAIAGQQPLHASATRAGNDVVLKVVNVVEVAQEGEVDVRGVELMGAIARMTVLTSASGTDENSLEQPTRVAPVQSTVPVTETTLRHTFPANSLTVIRLPARE